MKTARRRPYRKVKRAESAERTVQAAQRAAVALWRERDFDEVTLADVAQRAGVTVQTLIRRFGSKQGLLDRCLEGGSTEVHELRNRARAGDPRGAVRVLMEHYERDGDAVLRTLQVEGRSETASRIVATGRAEHRAWCARVFAPFLPAPKRATYGARLDAFVAATDVYLWKLWRRDLERSEEATLAAWHTLVDALVGTATERDLP